MTTASGPMRSRVPVGRPSKYTPLGRDVFAYVSGSDTVKPSGTQAAPREFGVDEVNLAQIRLRGVGGDP